MKRIKILKEDEIVINKRELSILLFKCRCTFQNGSSIVAFLETPTEGQQEICDRYAELFSRRADQINKFLKGLD